MRRIDFEYDGSQELAHSRLQLLISIGIAQSEKDALQELCQRKFVGNYKTSFLFGYWPQIDLAARQTHSLFIKLYHFYYFTYAVDVNLLYFYQFLHQIPLFPFCLFFFFV